MPTTQFILDGSNLAHVFAAKGPPTLKRLLLVTSRLEDLWGEGAKIVTLVDRSLGAKLPREERAEFDWLVKRGKIAVAPPGHEADEYILAYAKEKIDAIVVSNDAFKDRVAERVGVPLLRLMVIDNTVLFRQVDVYVRPTGRPIAIPLPSGSAVDPPTSVRKAIEIASHEPPNLQGSPAPKGAPAPKDGARQREDELTLRVIGLINGLLRGAQEPLDLQAIEMAARSYYPTFPSWLDQIVGGPPHDRVRRFLAAHPERFELVDLDDLTCVRAVGSGEASPVEPTIAAPTAPVEAAPDTKRTMSAPTTPDTKARNDTAMAELIRAVVAAAGGPLGVGEIANRVRARDERAFAWIQTVVPGPKMGKWVRFFKQRPDEYAVAAAGTDWVIELRKRVAKTASPKATGSAGAPAAAPKPIATAAEGPLAGPLRATMPGEVGARAPEEEKAARSPTAPPAAPPPRLLTAPAAPYLLVEKTDAPAPAALPADASKGRTPAPPHALPATIPPPMVLGELLEWIPHDGGRGYGWIYTRGAADNVLVKEQHVIEADRRKMRAGVFVHFRCIRIADEILATDLSVVGSDVASTDHG